MSASTAPPTGTVTFLFTDIEGSTRLWEAQPEAMRPALARHDALLRQSIEASGGFIFKTVGDAFCAAFAVADAALEAVLNTQRALAAEPWLDAARISIRAALHTGAAQERGGDYLGPTLNRVARLLAVAHGGQTLLSEVTQGLVRDTLPAEVTLQGLGEHRLKDLGRPEQIFQLRHPDLPADFPPLRSLDNPDFPNNLPQQVTSFIGRENEVAAVKAMTQKSRLVTLVGSGGAGKTRLSLQVAADLLEQFPDGAWLIELAPLSDPALVPQAAAQVLGIKEQPGQPLARTLMQVLKTKSLLIVLDNCEHLLSACAALVSDLLRECPYVSFLASSREAMNIAGEQTYRIPSLALPPPQQTQTAEAVSQYEAVTLFIQRAQSVQSLFTVTDNNAPAVAQVCWRLDGIPLAIELAAARLRAMPVEQVMARLDDRFHLLTGGSRMSLPRQQTLRALIDWSYDLLTASEKTLLRRLSVFAGGWPLEAAEAVCTGEGIETFEVLDLLTSLVDKSLVIYEEGAGGRYRLLETVRQYAWDRLRENSEAAIGRQAAGWFLEFAAQARLAGPEQASWLERLETEHDNLRASLSWYQQSEDQRDRESGLRLAAALGLFWATRGRYFEGRQWLNKALERSDGNEGTVVRGNALHEAGTLAYDQGDHAEARALFEQSLTIKRRLKDEGGIALSLQSLGTIAYSKGDYPAARALIEESLAISRQQQNLRQIAFSLYSLGGITCNQGDYAAARDLFEESLTIRRQLGDVRVIATSLAGLGSVAAQQGDYAMARVFHEEGLALARRLENPRNIAHSLVNLGNIAAFQGDHAEAQSLYEESLAICRQVGDQEGIAYNLEGMAGISRSQGDYAEAQRLHRESLAIYHRIGDRLGIAASFEGMAAATFGQDQPLQAVRLWGTAASLRETLGIPLPTTEQEESDRRLTSARASLGVDIFTAAWESGLAVPLEQAVEYALASE